MAQLLRHASIAPRREHPAATFIAGQCPQRTHQSRHLESLSIETRGCPVPDTGFWRAKTEAHPLVAAGCTGRCNTQAHCRHPQSTDIGNDPHTLGRHSTTKTQALGITLAPSKTIFIVPAGLSFHPHPCICPNNFQLGRETPIPASTRRWQRRTVAVIT